MSLKHSKNIAQIQSDFGKFRKQYPRFVGTMAVTFFKENFRRQGFVDSSLEKWKPRRSKNAQRRAILVKTGRLRRSIRITNANANTVKIGSDVPYAQIHNEGGTISGTVQVRKHKRKTRKGSTTVKSHSRKVSTKIPKRQFAGNSKGLNKRIERQTVRQLERILNR